MYEFHVTSMSAYANRGVEAPNRDTPRLNVRPIEPQRDAGGNSAGSVAARQPRKTPAGMGNKNRAMITAVIVPTGMTAKAGTRRTIVAPEATMKTNLRPILSESLPMSGRQSDMMTSTGIVATAAWTFETLT